MHFESERWQVAVIPEPGRVVAFVNNCHTPKGTHISHVQNQIFEKLSVKILSDNPDIKEILTPNIIKSNLTLFVNCLIENPTFDTQVS